MIRALLRFITWLAISVALVWVAYTDTVHVVMPWWGVPPLVLAFFVHSQWQRLAAFREGYLEGAACMRVGINAQLFYNRVLEPADALSEEDIDRIFESVCKNEREGWRGTLLGPIADLTAPAWPAKDRKLS